MDIASHNLYSKQKFHNSLISSILIIKLLTWINKTINILITNKL